jgi:hypothetical protein
MRPLQALQPQCLKRLLFEKRSKQVWSAGVFLWVRLSVCPIKTVVTRRPVALVCAPLLQAAVGRQQQLITCVHAYMRPGWLSCCVLQADSAWECVLGWPVTACV